MTETTFPPEEPLTHSESEISLLDMLVVLVKHKKLILGLPFVVAVIATALSLKQPDIFTATVKVLPPQQSQSAATAILAQLGGAAGLASGLGGLKNPADVYVAMLRSRTVADAMIQRFGLMKPDEKRPSRVRQSLANVTDVSIGKDGVIIVAVDDQDPKRAADLANAYVDELLKFSGVLAVTEASQRRLFFERQLAQAKENLAKSEVSARQALEQGGVVSVDDQGRAMVATTSILRAQISMKEVQIGAMRSFANEHNPDLLMARQELDSIKRELAKLEGAGSGKASASAHGSESLRLLRALKTNEILVEQLTRQYELAKFDEAKNPAVIQVMDEAVPPDQKSKPQRTMSVLLSALAAGVFAVFIAFCMEAIVRARQSPQRSQQLQLLRDSLTKF